jgi:hypothetical protein
MKDRCDPDRTSAGKDGALPGGRTLEFAEVGDRIFGNQAKPRAGQESPARISDKHRDPGGQATVEESCYPTRKTAVVKEITDRDEIDLRRWAGGEVGGDHGHGDAVHPGIEPGRRDGIGIYVGGNDRACPGLGRSDADDARPCAEVENTAASDGFRPVEYVAGKHRTAGPSIGPIGRRRRPALTGKAPQPASRMGRVEANLGNHGHRCDMEVLDDKPLGFHIPGYGMEIVQQRFRSDHARQPATG